MKEFVIQNWKTLVVLAFAIAEVILLIFKKTIKLDTTKEKILNSLPVCIHLAEQLFESGSLKKDFVIKTVKEIFSLDSSFDSFIGSAIEKILSTPEKKGKSTYEK